MGTTNYKNTFISVAEDCPAITAENPVEKNGKPTAASLQFKMIAKHPYKFDSDDVLFNVFAVKNEITKSEFEVQKEKFFMKVQPCFRASPLTKRYGWGVHSNEKGKIAIYPVESAEYKKLSTDKNLTQLKAMRSSKK